MLSRGGAVLGTLHFDFALHTSAGSTGLTMQPCLHGTLVVVLVAVDALVEAVVLAVALKRCESVAIFPRVQMGEESSPDFSSSIP